MNIFNAFGLGAGVKAKGSCGANLKWELSGYKDDLTLTISGYGEMSNYAHLCDIPWYYQRAYINTLVLSKEMTTIGETVFFGCSNLTVATIPDSVITIGKLAFANCRGLKAITIPNSVKTIGREAFGDCSGLTSIAIGNSVITIGTYAFDDCGSLKAVTIPDSVKSIEYGAFNNCSGLKSIIIGKSVKTIGEFALADCSGLTEVTNLSVTPQSISLNVFRGVELGSEMLLVVPVSALEKYEKSLGWKYFNTIIGQ